MGELSESGWNVVGKVTAGSISPAVATVLLASGHPVLQAAAIPAALTVNAGIEEAVRRLRPWRTDVVDRATHFVQVVEDVSERNFVDLIDQASLDAGTRELFRRVAEEVGRSYDEHRIYNLARLFVTCGTDPDRVNDGSIVLDILRQLEGPHLKLIELLGREDSPEEVYGLSHDAFAPRKGTQVRGWRLDDLTPEVTGMKGTALDAVGSRLVSLGLIYKAGEAEYVKAVWALTPLGRMCAGFLGLWAAAGATETEPEA